MKLSVIIPCYDEKETIVEIIEEIKKVNLFGVEIEIIVIDDCSKDGTIQILENLKQRFNFKLIRHSKNLGKGAAIKTGLKYVSGNYVIIQDADLEYSPNDYKKLLDCALKNNAEVVYGSRRLNSQNTYSYFSFYLGGNILTWLANLLYNIKITDEATCYKLFKTKTIRDIKLEYNGFEFCPEVTAKIAKKGIKIYEAPISYFPRHKKEGKKINWKDGFKAVWVLIKYKFFKS